MLRRVSITRVQIVIGDSSPGLLQACWLRNPACQASRITSDAASVHWSGNSGRYRPIPFQFAWWPSRRTLDRSRKLSRHSALHRRHRWRLGQRDRARCCFAVNRKPFEVKLQGLSSFGGRKPRAVVAAVEPSRPLIELQAELERTDAADGARSRGREIHAPCDAGAVARRLEPGRRGLSVRARLLPEPELSWRSRFVLFSSRASTGGGPYVVEDSYALCA